VGGNLFEKLYDAEWAHKNSVQGDTSVPLGIVALIGSGIVVLLKDYDARGGVDDRIFWGALTAACVAYAVAIYMLVRSFHGHVYRHLPFPSELKEYHDGLRAHYQALGTPLLADREFEAFLEQRLIDAADRNTENNLERAEYLRQANRGIIVAVMALTCAAVPYSLHERTKEAAPQKLEITNLQTAMAQNPRPAPGTQRPVPPKPIPPENFDVRIGVRAPRTR